LPDQELIPTPNETYEVSGQIRIQKGNKTNIRRFRKRDMEHNGPVDDPRFYDEILSDFTDEIDEEGSQTTLPVEEKAAGMKTGSTEAKEAAKKANDGEKKSLAQETKKK